MSRILSKPRTRPAALLAMALLVGQLSGLATTRAQAQQPSSLLPSSLEGVTFEQRLGADLPLDAPFLDETGAPVELGDFYGERPVVLALVYYECPMLCTLVLNGLSTALRPVQLVAAEDFEVVIVSFDSGETPELAREAKAAFVERFGKPEAAAGFHFLTGSEESVKRLAEAVGFEYNYLPESDEFAHAAGIVVSTPEGKAARYLFGVEYSPRDLRLALVEASENRIGTVVDQLLLFCFHYDPATGKYSTAVMNLVRAGGGLTVLALVAFVLLALRRDRQRALNTTLGTV